MKRRDEGKVSLVDFLRSIKFPHHRSEKHSDEDVGHFADFNPQARVKKPASAENVEPIRSAN